MMAHLLIANRGEIAVRIARAAQGLGIETTAVYSEADAGALHTMVTDHAVCIGPAPSTESYLNQDKILEVAKEQGCDAIHPGYGFLSENAGFARRVVDAGLLWVGPPAEAMDRMGDKVAARTEAENAGVPLAAGSPALKDAKDAEVWCERIGLPVMLKASAGGGGMGMRVVHEMSEVASSFEACRDQAASAFGIPDVFAEKFLTRPRHIEVQILADQHGNVVHLYERECSVQRRNQKLLEEAPSPALTQEQREELGARAVALAKQVGYTNAGTMEFLYQDGAFSFNEMNTRIQVEHPVTELVTGIDLVSWQLRVASGEPLDFTQDDVQLRGHAVELRVNAEDPKEDFRPCPGPVDDLHLPGGPGIRVDHGLRSGWTIPSHYDSMVLKLLAHGADRHEAMARARQACQDLSIVGTTTNQAFHEDLLADPTFLSADLSTRFLEEHPELGKGAQQASSDRDALTAIALALAQAPGGGLAGYQLLQDMPARIATSGGVRDWGMA